jgi:hypothetical protein
MGRGKGTHRALEPDEARAVCPWLPSGGSYYVFHSTVSLVTAPGTMYQLVAVGVSGPPVPNPIGSRWPLLVHDDDEHASDKYMGGEIVQLLDQRVTCMPHRAVQQSLRACWCRRHEQFEPNLAGVGAQGSWARTALVLIQAQAGIGRGRPAGSGAWSDATELRETVVGILRGLAANGRGATQAEAARALSCDERQLRRWLSRHGLVWAELARAARSHLLPY